MDGIPCSVHGIHVKCGNICSATLHERGKMEQFLLSARHICIPVGKSYKKSFVENIYHTK